jgi:hypothetical protein
MPYEPIVPEGQHLGKSHEVDEAVTGHLFDDATNQLQGHAAWQWVDEPEEDDFSPDYAYEPPRELTPEERELARQMAELIMAGIVAGVIAAAPHVQRWWNTSAVPIAKSTWKRISVRNATKKSAAAKSSSPSDQSRFVAPTTGADPVVRSPKILMSAAEWKNRFRAMAAAGAFADEQKRILSNAQIVDDIDSVESRAAMEELTPQQFVELIKVMLEANPSLLNDETSIELSRVFGTKVQPRSDALGS